MGREIYKIINDMSEVLNAPQMQKLTIRNLKEEDTIEEKIFAFCDGCCVDVECMRL